MLNRKDLSKYDDVVINDLIFLESDMIDFLENEIDRNELEIRLKLIIDEFERIGKEK